MKRTLLILSVALVTSSSALGAEVAGYLQIDRLEEIDGLEGKPSVETAALDTSGNAQAGTMNAVFTQPACNCLSGGGGVFKPFLQFIKASKKPKRPARALTCGTFRGDASWYTARRGALTASGRGFNPSGNGAAHKTLPFGTVVTVHCPAGRRVDVTIVDDGPHIAGRIIDLTRASADQCGITSRGHAPVTIEVKCPASTARSETPSANGPAASPPLANESPKTSPEIGDGSEELNIFEEAPLS